MPRRALQVLVCLALLASLLFLYRVRGVFTPFLIAALIAYLLYPLAHNLELRGVRYTAAIKTVFAAGAALAAIFIFFLIPALFNQVSSFDKIIPALSQTWSELQLQLGALSSRINLPGPARQVILELLGHSRTVVSSGLRGMTQDLLDLISLIPSFLLAPFLAYYMIRDFELIKKRFLSIFPPGVRNDVLYLLRETDRIFSKYLRGDLLVSLVVGTLTGIGAAIIGMPFYLLIGIFTGIADLIPVFGPIIAAFPVVGLALVQSRLQGVLMLAVYLVVQQLESSFISPRLLGDQMGMHPLVITLVLLIGGYLAGALGLILAVPLAALLRLLWRFLWERAV
jgi:predicted PurR-regulated permease PerM